MNIEEFKKDVTNKKIKDLWYFYKRSNDNKNALVRDMNSLTLFIKDKFYLIPLFDGDMDSSIITPLKQIKFRSCDLLIPNKSELFLDNTYKNWKLPILDNKD